MPLVGCSLIDDFSRFKISPDVPSDAGPNRTPDAAPSELCNGQDCTLLTDDCNQGECRDGQCVAAPIREGRQCGADNCTVCQAGQCAAPKDCSEYDGPCTQGVCNPANGVCATRNINEGGICFDNDPCTVSEACTEGVCKGLQRDCSAFDDQCGEGICEKDSGQCTFGPPNSSRTCDDDDQCTLDDRCDASGVCIATSNAPSGAACSDLDSCTGTLLRPDACDGAGTCIGGANVPPGMPCNDDNECTSPDACSGGGVCTGPAVRDGQSCETACKSGNTCQKGACLNADGESLGYKPECYFNWCGINSLCQDRLEHDGSCDCGCDFVDPDCNVCSPRMCAANTALGHRAAKWCDADGRAITICPETLKDDGKCDCGCQFADPDCNGGSCCGAREDAGCNNRFVENCVCERELGPDTDPSCCKQKWTQRCVELAVQLGCMRCP